MVCVDIAIIGAGFAGMGTAYFLAERQVGRVLLLEQEELPGEHASGLNAAMIRQQLSDPLLAKFAREGAHWLREERHTLPVPVAFHSCGSLLIGDDDPKGELAVVGGVAEATALKIERLDPPTLRRQFPVLERADFQAGIFCPTDGVVDINAFLHGLAMGFKQRGGEVWTRARVCAIRTEGERVVSLDTDRGTVHAGVVVNAAGAWAIDVGRMAGAEEISLSTRRRHLFYAEAASSVRKSDPFIWDVRHALYFRPETGGLLLSPCDSDPHPPGPCAVDPMVRAELEEKLIRHMPRLSGVRILKGWAALRTLGPDGRFVIRWDRQLKNFFWVAGLGGHGVTCAVSIGRSAADQIALSN